MASFTDYYEAELRKQKAAAPQKTAAPKAAPKTLDELNGANSDSGIFSPTNPIGWTLDMISRPLYGVQKKISTQIDEVGAAAKKLTGVQKTGESTFTVGKADPLGGALDLAKSILGISPDQAAAQAQGMFGNNEEDKVTTSKNIEKLVDTSNSATPGYTDVQDNVNPWVKGIGGFVGDVALDPLNLLPPVAIAKVGGTAAKLVKGAVSGAKDAVKPGAKAVEEAVKVAEEAPAARVTPEQVAAENANPMDFGPKNTGLDVPAFMADGVKPARASEEVAPTTAQAQDFAEPLITPHMNAKVDAAGAAVVEAAMPGSRNLRDVIKDSPKIPGMKKEIEALFNATKAAPDAPMSMNDFVKTSDQVVNVALPGDAVTKNYSVQQLAKIVATNKGVNNARAGAAFTSLKQTHEKFAQGQATAVTDSLAAFQRRMQNGEKVMRSTLGDQLVDHLASISSPKTMTDTLTTLSRVLAGAVDPASPTLSREATKAFDALRGFLPDTPKPAGVANVVGEPQRVAAELSRTSEAFRQTVRQEMLPGTPEFNAKYLPASGKNPLRFTSTDVDERLARWWRKGNQQFQHTLYGKLHDMVLKDRVVEVTGKELSELIGKPNAAAFRAAIDSTGEDITRAMETFGIPMHVGTSEDLIPISFPQVYKAANDALAAQFGDDAALLALYNGGSRVAFTNLMEGVHRMLTGGGLEDVAAAIRQPVKGSNNIISKAGKGWYAPVKAISPKMQELADQLGGKWVPNKTAGKQGFQLVLDGSKLPDLVAEALWNAKDEIAATVAENRAAWSARGISEAQDITGSVLRNLRVLADDPSKAAQKELASQIQSQSKVVADEAARIAATGEATIAADTMVHVTMGETVPRQAEAITTHESDIHAGMDPVDAAAKANDKGMAAIQQADPRDFQPSEVTVLIDDAFEEASKVAVGDGAVKAPTLDIGAQGAKDVFDTRDSWLGAPGTELGRRFNGDYGAKTLNPDARAAGTTASRFVTDAVIEPMNVLVKKFTPDVLANALRAVQQGTRVADGELAEATAGIKSIVEKLFDLTPVSMKKPTALGNIFMDNATNINHVNEMLRWAHRGTGQPLEFDLAGARTEAFRLNGNKKPSKVQVADQLRNQWRTWNFGDDASGQIVALGQAAARVAEHQAIATNFVRTGVKEGWVTKLAPGQMPPAGYVKIVDTQGGALSKMLPKNIAVQKDIAKELKTVNYYMTEPRQLTGEMGELVRSTVIPVTNSWKRLMTVMRLGHHIRNGIGNLSIQYVARGTRDMEKSWRHTLKLMGVRNDFEGMDALAALKGMGDDALPTGGDVLVSGKFGDITQQEIWDQLNREGLLPTYASSEGLMDDAVNNGAVAKAASFVSLEHTKLGHLAGKVSQNLDHYQRAHHFMQILMQESSKRGGKFTVKNKADLYRQAAREVKRSHPDSSMLSSFENSTMKLLIPFYTWMRGILPFAIESALQHPGRINNFNKASYNLAVGMGINPDSLSDPFPQDQLFPSYIRKSMFGPQFQLGDKYVRVNPGVAHADLAQSLMADPLRGVLGMVNPLLRVPAELASGGSWSTGAPIKDMSDYLDSSIPGVNYAANLTGISPTGSVGSLVSGQGLDPQAQVAAGNKDGFDQALTVANWITGLGIQNLTRPNYINAAEIEKRNAAAKGQTSGK